MYEFELEVALPEGCNDLKALELIPRVLEVDKELEPEILTREIIKKEHSFCIKIRSKDLKRMRAVVGGLYKHIKLIVNTIQQFA